MFCGNGVVTQPILLLLHDPEMLLNGVTTCEGHDSKRRNNQKLKMKCMLLNSNTHIALYCASYNT